MSNNQSIQLNTVWLIVILVTASIAIWFDIVATQQPGPHFPTELSDVILPTPRYLNAFQLIDYNNKAFALKQLKGQWSFLFFGYTHCPDVCPTALGIMAELFERLKKEEAYIIKNTQLVFITVDPEKDTPEHLHKYIGYFNPDFLAVTGLPNEIKEFAKQLGAIYFTSTDSQKSENLPATINHTSAYFLIDPFGRLVAIFPEYNNADIIFTEYTRIRQFVKSRNLYRTKVK